LDYLVTFQRARVLFSGQFWTRANTYELKEYEAAVQSMEMAVNLNRSYAGDKDGMIVAAVSLANLGRFQDAYGALDTLKDNNKNITVAEIDNVRREIAKVQKSKLKQTQ